MEAGQQTEQPLESVGFVALVCGELHIRDQQGGLRIAAEWDPVYRNEKLISNDECAAAAIMLHNGVCIRLEPNTEMILDDDLLERG